MYPSNYFNEGYKRFELLDYEGLSAKERVNVSDIRNVIDGNKRNTFLDIIRIIVSLIGLIVLVWSVLLGVAYLFDKSNNIFEKSLISVISFNVLRYSETDIDNGKRGVICSRNIVKYVVSGVFIVFFLLSVGIV